MTVANLLRGLDLASIATYLMVIAFALLVIAIKLPSHKTRTRKK